MSKPLHILLVDDDPSEGVMLDHRLKEQNVDSTLTVVDGHKSAMEAVRQHPFDLILLDVKRPDSDVNSLCRHIMELQMAAAPPKPKIKVYAGFIAPHLDQLADAGIPVVYKIQLISEVVEC